MTKIYTFLAVFIAVMVCVQPVSALTDYELAAQRSTKELSQNTAPDLLKSVVSDVNKENSFEELEGEYVSGEVLVKFKNDKIKLSTAAGKLSAQNFAVTKSLVTKMGSATILWPSNKNGVSHHSLAFPLHAVFVQVHTFSP